MIRNYVEYSSLKIEGKTLKDVVLLAREEHKVSVNLILKNESDKYFGHWIPFNLEREYVDELIDNKNYDEARNILKRMRYSYPDTDFQNFIESYEYHLKSIIQSEKIIKESIIEAKKEFNQHTITLIGIIVGVITIFGSANIVIENKSYVEMFLTFITIVISVITVIVITTLLNIKFPKNKEPFN